jgi:hypothetical protein
MDTPNTYDDYTVYVPHAAVVTEDQWGYHPTLTEVLVAGYHAYGIKVEPGWIETEWKDTYEV